jgi:uncharacterized membrane protein required for colicin V production
MTKDGRLKYFQETKLIIRTEGFFGLYRSFCATALCVVPGWGYFFGAYEYYKKVGENIIPTMQYSEEK